MRSKARFIIAISLAVVLGGWLAWTSIGGSLETYAGPGELRRGTRPTGSTGWSRRRAQGRRRPRPERRGRSPSRCSDKDDPTDAYRCSTAARAGPVQGRPRGRRDRHAGERDLRRPQRLADHAVPVEVHRRATITSPRKPVSRMSLLGRAALLLALPPRLRTRWWSRSDRAAPAAALGGQAPSAGSTRCSRSPPSRSATMWARC